MVCFSEFVTLSYITYIKNISTSIYTYSIVCKPETKSQMNTFASYICIAKGANLGTKILCQGQIIIVAIKLMDIRVIFH